MKIGNFLVPEMRLDELLGNTLKKIYFNFKTESVQSKDLSGLLGYKYGTEPTLFKKINSMLAYGILEGRGVYTVTKLGEDLLYPESSELEKQLKTKAVMNVELWKKLYEKYGKGPPKDGFWVSIRTITEVDPETAKKDANRIYNWYVEDADLIAEEYVDSDLSKHITPSEAVSPSPVQRKSMLQQQMQSRPFNIGDEAVSEDKEKIPFGKSYIVLPKDDLKKEWEKFQKFMKIYLEDYKELEKEIEPSENQTQSDPDSEIIKGEKVSF